MGPPRCSASATRPGPSAGPPLNRRTFATGPVYELFLRVEGSLSIFPNLFPNFPDLGGLVCRRSKKNEFLILPFRRGGNFLKMTYKDYQFQCKKTIKKNVFVILLLELVNLPLLVP